MKKLFSAGILIMLFTLTANAQTPQLAIENRVHDFGAIQEDNGLVTTTFEFTNNGDAPLVINRVLASCGCATPDWTREPIPAKGKGNIQVTYNPKGRPGPFSKSVTVRSNVSGQPLVLVIKGEVVQATIQR